MQRLHYFNPGHEAAVLTRSLYYTPPANVGKMAVDLASIPAWYADEGDYYLTSQLVPSRFFSSLPPPLRPWARPLTPSMLAGGRKLPQELKAEPWGVSPQSLALFGQLAQESGVTLHLPRWDDRMVELVGRQTSARCLTLLHERLPGIALPSPPSFCSSVQEAEAFINLQARPCVMKLPYSSSGRGLRWVTPHALTPKDREWIAGGLRRQGAVSIEIVLDRRHDCALEFYCNGQGGVQYEGFSSFVTSDKGAYQGNRLQAHITQEPALRAELPPGRYDAIKAAVTDVVAHTFGAYYHGYLGVDMLLYHTDRGEPALYPFVEVNLRHTFGLVAQRLSQRLLSPRATGHLAVVHNPLPGALHHTHLEMRKAHPLALEADRLLTGYLPLTPVTPQSAYAAYLIAQ